jgi:uncharacterized membrane protein YfcA
MTVAMAAGLGLLMIGTAFLSRIFGMAGGMVLIGVLLFLLPLPAAMVLHAVTQMASNAWRALLWWRYIRWQATFFYVTGCLIAVGLWSLTLYVPEKPVALLMLGLSPFVLRAIPERLLPATLGPLQTIGGGMACMALMLLTGVAALVDHSSCARPWAGARSWRPRPRARCSVTASSCSTSAP